ncbi:MAG: FkbM family methyltransferase [Actinomycetota bacterium]|nr:FkbM family methyltransferase [Actinomycetota bacterium]
MARARGILVSLRDRWRFIGRVTALAPDRRGAWWLALVVLTLPVKARLGALHRAHVKVRIVDHGTVHTLYLSEHADFEVLLTALVDEEFAVSLPRAPATVLDVGAHVGLTVLLFRRLFPGASVVAVEPNPHNFRKLERNVGQLDNVTVVPVAVGGDNGEGRFDAEAPSWTSRLLRDQEDGSGVQVPIRSLDALVSEFGIDPASCLVKLDAEGFEWETLSSSRVRNDFLAIVGDLHRDLLPVSAERFFDLFERYEVSGRSAESLFYAIQRDPNAADEIGGG